MKKQPARIRKPEEALYHLVEVLDVLRLGVDTYISGRTSAWMIVSAYLHQILTDKTKGNTPLAARVIPSLKLHPMRIDISSSNSIMYSPIQINASNLNVFDWSRPRIPLNDWLKQVAYVQPQNNQGVNITLEELIKSPRHQAGGVHFDEEISETMRLIEGVLTFIRLGGNHLSFRDYIVAIGDYIHTELNSDLIGCLGNGYIKSGDTSKAQEFLVTAINHSRATGNLHLLCEQLANLGRLHYQLQDLFQSEHCYTEALSICQSAQDREMELECQRSLAIVYLGLGNNQSNNANEINAIDYYKKALAYSRAIGDQVHEIILLSNLGIVYRRLGILRKAFTVWIATLLLDLDIDKIGSSDTGNVRSIIEKVTYNLSIATKSEPVFSTIIGEIATNWKRAITEATSQEYAELGSVDVETLNRVITNLLESA